VSDHARARLRIGLLMFVAILVQTTLGSDLRVAQVAPDLMVLIAICAGVVGGAESGAFVGFFAGLVADLFLTSTPLGLSALAYCLVGAAIGQLRSSYFQERRLLIPVAAFVGTAGAVIVFVAIGDMLGQSQLLDAGRAWLIRVAVIEALWNAVLAIPFMYLYGWAARSSVGAERIGATRSGTFVNDKVVAR
jgi:rod shape-determining protein MreD